MLDTVPDLRPTLATATEAELADIFRAFDVEITYDKDRQILNLAATITPELLPDFDPNENDRPGGRSQINGIAGAGSVRISPTTTTSCAVKRTRSQKCASSHEQADLQAIGATICLLARTRSIGPVSPSEPAQSRP
jgi:hypothetical protein